jgi:dienelactone hydrolase
VNDHLPNPERREFGMKRRVGVALVAAVLLGGAACSNGAKPAGSDRSASTTSPAAVGEPNYLSSSIPDTPVGAQFRWLLEATRTLPIPVPDIEAHFAAEFLGQLPPDQLNMVLAQAGDGTKTRVLGVLAMTPASLDVAVDDGDGTPRVVISVAVDGEGKISALFGKPFPLAPRALLGLAPVSMPEPTGPAAVGTDTVVATDAARDGRRIPAQLWYPAATGDVDGAGTASYAPPGTAAFLAERLGVPPEDVSAIDTHATAAPAPDRAGRLPVVVFSPGFGGTRPFYSGLSAELASHGYLVAVVDHPGDGQLVEYPDGPPVTAGPPPVSDEAFEGLLAPRVADVRTILDLLERLDAEAGGRFHQAFDLSRVALAGHSFGGATAAEAMRLDGRFRIGINLDGTMSGDVLETGVDRPFLLVSSGRPEEPEEDEMWVRFRTRTATAQWLLIAGSGHMSFSDWPALSSFRPADEAPGSLGVDLGTIDRARSFEVQSAYVLAFLDRHLRGEQAPLLDGPSPQYPEVTFR